MRGTTRRWVGAWVCGLVVLSCGWASRSSPDRDGSPRKLAVLLYGFFESDNARQFAPERARRGYVDLQKAHDAIVGRARSLDWAEPFRVLSWAESVALVDREYSEAELGLLEVRRRDALEVLDAAAQIRGASREEPTGLKAPFLPSGEWRADDRVLAVLGLETLRRPDPKAVTSVVGCFWFSGDGAYRDLRVSAYHPTQLGTLEFAAAASDACFRASGGRGTKAVR